MIKIYSTDYFILERVCKDYDLTPEYTYRSIFNKNKDNIAGEGYVESGGYLRVFCKNSHVDISDDFKDITEDYVPKQFKL